MIGSSVTPSSDKKYWLKSGLADKKPTPKPTRVFCPLTHLKKPKGFQVFGVLLKKSKIVSKISLFFIVYIKKICFSLTPCMYLTKEQTAVLDFAIVTGSGRDIPARKARTVLGSLDFCIFSVFPVNSSQLFIFLMSQPVSKY